MKEIRFPNNTGTAHEYQSPALMSQVKCNKLMVKQQRKDLGLGSDLLAEHMKALYRNIEKKYLMITSNKDTQEVRRYNGTKYDPAYCGENYVINTISH